MQASQLLDVHRVVQLFEHVDRLPRGGRVKDSIGDRSRSFASVWKDPRTFDRQGWDNHGHTGYAWAARRDLFAHSGLYDAAILGNGDDLMAHAFLGEFSSVCITANYAQDQAMYHHYQQWAKRAYRALPLIVIWRKTTIGDIPNSLNRARSRPTSRA